MTFYPSHSVTLLEHQHSRGRIKTTPHTVLRRMTGIDINFWFFFLSGFLLTQILACWLAGLSVSTVMGSTSQGWWFQPARDLNPQALQSQGHQTSRPQRFNTHTLARTGGMEAEKTGGEERRDEGEESEREKQKREERCCLYLRFGVFVDRHPS